ncbi:MAG: hypothetical protein ABI472_03530 [Ginsengibacter sp.]
MKESQFIKLVILFFYTIACVNKNAAHTASDTDKDKVAATSIVVADTIERGKVVTPVLCKADPAESYAVYIPGKSYNETLPVIYFFDPHGDGSYPLIKYKALADAYNFILIGSNNSKNGNDWQTANNTWTTLTNDTQNRLKVNRNRVYTCGFSGGAKVATYLALHHMEIKGVIANGAGLPDITHAGNFGFSFTAIAGQGDLNMTDLVTINSDLDKTQAVHRIIFFDGRHEWAPENTMNIAFAGLQLDAMRQKLTPINETFISNYVVNCKKQIALYVKMTKYLNAETETRLSISMLDGLTNEVNWFKVEDGSLKKNPLYQKQWQAKQNLLLTEQNIKAEYEQQFQQGDMNYWKETISNVQTNAKAQTPMGAMYQRLQAYLSLAFYSISNQLIGGKRDNEALYFVDLYKMADATNSEAWYFSAILDARSSDAKATQEDLLKAAGCGFRDKERLLKQPEFQSLGTSINLAEIESKMR